MTAKLRVAAAALVVAAATAWAQPQPPEGGPAQPPRPPMGAPGMDARAARAPRPDPMEENFFPPEMVMRNQKAISLTPDQQTAIRLEMQKMVSQFTDLQWKLSAEEETLATLLKAERPDEKQVLAQLDAVLAIENGIKRSHLAALVRIKNALTADQQAKLTELKKRAPQWMQGPAGELRLMQRAPDGPQPGGELAPGGPRPGGQRPPNPPPEQNLR